MYNPNLKSMKKATLFFILIAICFTFSAHAVTTETLPFKSEQLLRSEIISLVGDETPFEIQKDEEVVSRVCFLLNEANELIIISVHSDREEVVSFLKRKLDHRALNVKGVQKGKIFNIRFKFLES